MFQTLARARQREADADRDERRRLDAKLGDAVGAAQRLDEEDVERVQRRLAEGEEQQARDENGHGDGEDRRGRRPEGRPTTAGDESKQRRFSSRGGRWRTVRRPPSRVRAPHQQTDLRDAGLADPRRADRAPPAITAIVSQSVKISSRSCEITTTAAPAAASATSALWIAAAAPASTPHVGWLTTSRAGSCSTSRPTTNFCRLPPESERASAAGPLVRTSKSRMMSLANRVVLRLVDDAEARQGLAHVARQQGVLRQAHARHGGVAVALLRHETGAERAPLGGRHVPRRDAVDHHGIGLAGGDLPRQRVHQLGLPVAGHAGDPEDLALGDGERHRLEVDAELAVRARSSAGPRRGSGAAAALAVLRPRDSAMLLPIISSARCVRVFPRADRSGRRRDRRASPWRRGRAP